MQISEPAKPVVVQRIGGWGMVGKQSQRRRFSESKVPNPVELLLTT